MMPLKTRLRRAYAVEEYCFMTHTRRSSTGAVLTNLTQLAPDHIVICVGGKVVEVTLPILIETLISSGYLLGRRCPFTIIIPRRGWALLVPRAPEGRESLRIHLDHPIQLPPRRCA